MDLSGEPAGLIAIGLLFAFMLAIIPGVVAMGLAAFIGFLLTGEAGSACRSMRCATMRSTCASRKETGSSPGRARSTCFAKPRHGQ